MPAPTVPGPSAIPPREEGRPDEEVHELREQRAARFDCCIERHRCRSGGPISGQRVGLQGAGIE
jgi:hypothetical protein